MAVLVIQTHNLTLEVRSKKWNMFSMAQPIKVVLCLLNPPPKKSKNTVFLWVQSCKLNVTPFTRRKEFQPEVDMKTMLWSFIQTPGKTALVFLSTLIYRYKLLLPQVVWLGLGGIWCSSVWITPAVSYCYAAASVSLSKTQKPEAKKKSSSYVSW